MNFIMTFVLAEAALYNKLHIQLMYNSYDQSNNKLKFIKLKPAES